MNKEIRVNIDPLFKDKLPCVPRSEDQFKTVSDYYLGRNIRIRALLEHPIGVDEKSKSTLHNVKDPCVGGYHLPLPWRGLSGFCLVPMWLCDSDPGVSNKNWRKISRPEINELMKQFPFPLFEVHKTDFKEVSVGGFTGMHEELYIYQYEFMIEKQLKYYLSSIEFEDPRCTQEYLKTQFAAINIPVEDIFDVGLFDKYCTAYNYFV